MSSPLTLRCGATQTQSSKDTADSKGLLLEFNKQGDRFSHRLCIPDGPASYLTLLESYTLDPLAPWPSDPPLQQVVFEPLGPNQQDVALGVGLSGHGHWSLAARCCDSPEAIELDFACRISRPTHFLGSTYRVLHQPPHTSTSGLTLSHAESNEDGWTAKWQLQNGKSITLHLQASIGTVNWEPSTAQLQVLPQALPQTTVEKPTTLRWCFHIAIRE